MITAIQLKRLVQMKISELQANNLLQMSDRTVCTGDEIISQLVAAYICLFSMYVSIWALCLSHEFTRTHRRVLYLETTDMTHNKKQKSRRGAQTYFQGPSNTYAPPSLSIASHSAIQNIDPAWSMTDDAHSFLFVERNHTVFTVYRGCSGIILLLLIVLGLGLSLGRTPMLTPTPETKGKTNGEGRR